MANITLIICPTQLFLVYAGPTVVIGISKKIGYLHMEQTFRGKLDQDGESHEPHYALKCLWMSCIF